MEDKVIYLTGALRSYGECYQQMMEAAAAVDHTCKSITSAAEVWTYLDISQTSKAAAMAPRLSALLSANLVLTLDDFEDDLDSKTEVGLARQYEIPVVNYRKYFHDHFIPKEND